MSHNVTRRTVLSSIGVSVNSAISATIITIALSAPKYMTGRKLDCIMTTKPSASANDVEIIGRASASIVRLRALSSSYMFFNSWL